MVREIFDLPSILQAAADAEETNDFWGTEYREALEVLVPSMADEAGLYPARAWRVVRSMLEVLGMRANIAKWLRAHSEARLPAIRRPIFITGLPRTGTTMLHNLLAGLPGHRGFTPWQMQ
ncbi:MAG TPA: sulfotransferase, partial [Polyangium sp.]|nr:sulfotransferase [Polyangium sp.]